MHDHLPGRELATDGANHTARSTARQDTASRDGAVSPLCGPEGGAAGRYGTAEVAASGVDRSQLRRNLRLTPTERVEQMVAFVRSVLPLQGAVRRRQR